MKFANFVRSFALTAATLGPFNAGNAVAQENGDEAIAEAVAVENGIPAEKIDPKVRPLTLSVDLLNGNKISGTLVDTTQLSMKTSFGEASIPLGEVAGVRLASGEDVSTTVVMLNGDSITGATDIKQLTIDTDWGTARINGSAIQSLLFVPNVQWNAASNLSGRRWSLIDNATTTPGAVPSNGQSTANRPGTSNTQPRQVSPTPIFRNGVIISQ